MYSLTMPEATEYLKESKITLQYLVEDIASIS